MGVGRIYSHGSNSVELRVQFLEEFAKIIEHLEKYPLITQKLADYKGPSTEFFFLKKEGPLKQAYDFMLNNEHLKEVGLRKFVYIKATINFGLSPELKKIFS